MSTPAGSIASVPSSSIFDVLEEKLALKLEKRKVPVDILVVDRADRSPAQNQGAGLSLCEHGCQMPEFGLHFGRIGDGVRDFLSQ